ncbi:MAG: DUF4139 domain-containing protein [Myxococcales bacterium]|nr:DUF4139 domain-containing protein [Myxococcales bacterium]
MGIAAPRVDSQIDRVVVFPGAAWVTRIARAPVTSRAELVLAGLPAALDDDSVQLAVRGPARAADVRVIVEVTAAGEAGAVDDAELHACRRAAAAAEATVVAVRGELGGLSSLAARGRPDRDREPPAWGEAVVARLALVELRAAREAELRAALAAAEDALEAARRALTAAETRRCQASSPELAPGSVRKALVITVEPEGDGGEVEVAASYLVPGARWAPSYVVRLDGAGGLRLELRASIAQATGEDWAGVALEVSTAAPLRRLELPELPALRIGRAQPPPARAGWRAAPSGVEALFADWDRGFGARRAPARATPEPAPTAAGELAADDGPDLAPQTAPVPAPAMTAPPAGNRTLAMGLGVEAKSRGRLGGAVAVGRAREGSAALEQRARAASSPADAEREVGATLGVRVDLLAYAALCMRGPHEPGRGRLELVSRGERWGAGPEAAGAARRARAAAAAVSEREPPRGHVAAVPGAYDHAFAAEARLDVPGDGAWHNVALLARAGKVALHHVAVPAVAPEVYRVASFTSPLDAPLLAGPVDVYDRGELVVSAELAETAPGGTVELGLGVDATVKTARNARFREEAAGVLRGALKLVHEVTITVENLAPRAIQLEVRERLPRPAPGAEDVEVVVDRVAPSWEPWRPEPEPGQPQLVGGHRWRLEIPAGARRDLQLDYHVRIAGRHELVGGNRREP